MSVHATRGLTKPPGPPGQPPQRSAGVIYLQDHQPPLLLEDPVAVAVPGGPEASDDDVGMATIFEALFNARAQSLADPETAAVFRASLETFLVLLDAAQRSGVITAGQYQQLGATLGAADRFPDLV